MHVERHEVVQLARVHPQRGCIGGCQPSGRLEPGDVTFEHAHGGVRRLRIIAAGCRANDRDIAVQAAGVSGAEGRLHGAPAAAGHAAAHTRSREPNKPARASERAHTTSR
jgi:hypothetical protein